MLVHALDHRNKLWVHVAETARLRPQLKHSLATFAAVITSHTIVEVSHLSRTRPQSSHERALVVVLARRDLQRVVGADQRWSQRQRSSRRISRCVGRHKRWLIRGGRQGRRLSCCCYGRQQCRYRCRACSYCM